MWFRFRRSNLVDQPLLIYTVHPTIHHSSHLNRTESTPQRRMLNAVCAQFYHLSPRLRSAPRQILVCGGYVSLFEVARARVNVHPTGLYAQLRLTNPTLCRPLEALYYYYNVQPATLDQWDVRLFAYIRMMENYPNGPFFSHEAVISYSSIEGCNNVYLWGGVCSHVRRVSYLDPRMTVTIALLSPSHFGIGALDALAFMTSARSSCLSHFTFSVL